MKEKTPTLAAALSKVSDWHYHGNELELIFPDAYTAQKIASNLREIQETFYSVLKEKLKLKAVTVAEHENELASAAPSQKKEGIHSDDTINMVKNIFRGNIVNKTNVGGN